MLTIESIREIIDLNRDRLARYSITGLKLFGSYARGEQTESSDIDLLVNFKKVPDLLTFIELEEYLSEKLGRHVDLVPERKLRKEIAAQVHREAIAL